VELLDEVQIRAINLANGKSLPEVPTLMFEFIGTGRLVVQLAWRSYVGIEDFLRYNFLSCKHAFTISRTDHFVILFPLQISRSICT
jgi:hypothetical protein